MTKPPRQCGECQLCCKLLPMKEIAKPAGKPCPQQRHGKGCAIYPTRPPGCRLWSCRWLLDADTADLRRPDRSRYVVDMMPDFVEWVNNETGECTPIEVVQVWCDPHQRDAWRDPALLAFIERRAEEGKAALIRWSARDGMTVFAPTPDDPQWHEVRSESVGHEHTAAEKYAAVKAARRLVGLALLLAALLAAPAAFAQSLPLPKTGQCPAGYRDSGACAPTSDRERPAIPKPAGRQCPSGWSQSGSYCIGPIPETKPQPLPMR